MDGERRRAAAAGDRRMRSAARIAYLLVIAIATLTAIDLDLDAARINARLARVLAPELTPGDAIDAARNVVLFAGWGLVWMISAAPGRRLLSLAAAVASGAALSLSVEGVQLLSSTRTPSVLDLATNTGGALLGAVAVVAMEAVMSARRRARSYLGLPAIVFAASYSTAVLGEALIPLFRQTPVPGGWGGPFRRFAASAAAFEWGSALDLPWLDLPLFLPAGLLCVVALAEEGLSYREAAGWTATVGVAAMAAVEVAHGILGLPMVVGSALLHGVAIAAGAILALRVVPPFTRRWRGVGRARLVAAGYAVVVLLWIVRPYMPETSPGAVLTKLGYQWWAPLRSLSMRGDLYSVMDVATSFFLYLPLGALLAVWPLRRTGPLRAFLPALYLAAGAELAQLFIAGRTLDSTDALVNGAGVVVGWALLRRAGFRERDTLTSAPERDR